MIRTLLTLRLTRRSALAAIVLTIATVGAALAYFTSAGTGSASATTGSLTAPNPSATVPTAGQAHIAWTAVTLSPDSPSLDTQVTYVVERSSDGGSTWHATSNTCAGTLPSTRTSCDDIPSPGAYTYRVTATFHSWTSVGLTGSVLVTKASPTLSLVGPGNPGSDTAGTAVAPSSITATLSSGVAPTGTITFVEFGPQASPPSSPCSGGMQIGTTRTVSGNGGYNPTAGFTPTAAGSYWLYATYTGDSSNDPATSSCPPGAAQEIVVSAATPSQVAITPAPSFATASSTTNIQLSLQLRDQFGNNTTSSGTTTLALSTGSANGFFATTNGATGTATINATFTTGVGTATEFYGDKTASASTTITAKNGATTWGTTTVTITAGTASQAAITPTPSSATANNKTSIQLSLQLQDQFGNNTTSSGTNTLTLSTASATGFFAATTNTSGSGSTINVTFTNGVGTGTTFYGDTITSASTTISAKNGATTWGTTTVTITAGTASQVAITPSPSSATASSTTNIQLSLQLKDQFGNNTTSSGTTTLALTTGSANGFFATTNGASGTATINATFTTGVGTATEFYGDKTASASTTITAKNGATTWGTTTVTITAGSPAGLGLAGVTAGLTPSAGCSSVSASESCTYSGAANGGNMKANVTFVDAFGNPTVESTSGISTIDLSNPAKGGVSPSSLQVPANQSTTSAQFTLTKAGSNAATTTISFGSTFTMTLTLS